MLENLLTPAAVALENRCAKLVSILFAGGVAVTFAERLAASRLYADSGLMSWRVLSFDRARNGVLFRHTVLSQSLFGGKGARASYWAGLAGVVLVLLSPARSYSFTAGMLPIVLSCVLAHLRTTYAGDGAQQMSLIVGVALLLGFNPWVTPAAGAVCLLFIAAQSALSYLASGVAKLISPIWMRGDALVRILATTAFGCELGFRLASISPRFTRMLCQVTVIVEVLFPFLLFGPRWMMIAFFVWGFTFHLANAFLMGLNTFLWAFLSTYPALYFAWCSFHSWAR